jgi:cytochrome P450
MILSLAMVRGPKRSRSQLRTFIGTLLGTEPSSWRRSRDSASSGRRSCETKIETCLARAPGLGRLSGEESHHAHAHDRARHESQPLRYDPFEVGDMADPYPLYERLREEAPLYHHAAGDFWVLSRFDDVFRATRDFTSFSSARGLTFIRDEMKLLGLAPTFIMMDPPQHTALRRLISKGFTPDRVSAMEPRIREFVRGRVEQLAQRCAAGETPNVVDEYTSPLPTFVLAELLGVPPEDRPRFDPWSRAITSASMEPEPMGAAVHAVAQLFGYFVQLLERRRVDPGDDMLSALRAAEIDGQKLSNWDLLGFCFVFIAGGNDTTNHMLANALVRLQEHPEQRAWLVANPDRIGPAVDEFLRFDAPVQGLSRTLTGELELHGQRLPEGRQGAPAVRQRQPRPTPVRRARGRAGRHARRAAPHELHPGAALLHRRPPGSHDGAHRPRGAAAALPEYRLDLAGAVRTRSAFVRGYDVLPFHASLSRAAGDRAHPPRAPRLAFRVLEGRT